MSLTERGPCALDDTDAHAYRFWVDFLLGKDCPGILEPIEDGKARRVRQCFQGFVDVNSHEFLRPVFSISRYLPDSRIKLEGFAMISARQPVAMTGWFGLESYCPVR